VELEQEAKDAAHARAGVVRCYGQRISWARRSGLVFDLGIGRSGAWGRLRSGWVRPWRRRAQAGRLVQSRIPAVLRARGDDEA
jgi:hypothetical protein